MQVVDVPKEDQGKALGKLKNDPSVKSVDPNFLRSANAVPNDARYADQWALTQIGWDSVYDQAITGTANVADPRYRRGCLASGPRRQARDRLCRARWQQRHE